MIKWTDIKDFFLSLLPHVHLIGSLSSIAGLLLVVFKPDLLRNNYQLAVVVVFATILAIFVIDSFRLRRLNLKLNKTNFRLKKAKEAYNKVSMGLAILNLADRLNHNISLHEKRKTLKEFLNELSNAYTLLSGTPCSTTIKIPIEGQSDDLFLYTVCRDSNVRGRNHQLTENSKQYIYKNTSFEYLLQNLNTPDGRSFFENNLPLRRAYKNASFELYSNFTFNGIPDDWSDKERMRVWKLPYKSTIVVPILPHPDLEEEKLDFKGFLTVDCKEINAFDSIHDVELLISAADSIYNYVDEMIDMVEEKFKEEQGGANNEKLSDKQADTNSEAM